MPAIEELIQRRDWLVAELERQQAAFWPTTGCQQVMDWALELAILDDLLQKYIEEPDHVVS